MTSTVGLALIARDEAENLPNLLASIEGAFDQIALVDTGSTDQTVGYLTDWAERQRLSLGFKVEAIEWADDFGAARTHADGLLDTDWLSSADADDVVTGAENLRELAADAPAHLRGYVAGYNYSQDGEGRCTRYHLKPRLVRAGAGKWVGRVHESLIVDGEVAEVEPEVCEWVHRVPPDPDPGARNRERNIRILRKWIEDEPDNPDPREYLAYELGDQAAPIGWPEAYLALAQANYGAGDYLQGVGWANLAYAHALGDDLRGVE